MKYTMNPELDLLLEREIDVPPEAVWSAWTTPAQLMQWFCPLPYTTIKCEIDLRPGGKFHTTMRSPEGEEFPGTGCYLEVVPNERLVFTSALGPGFRPNVTSENDFPFTAVITLEATSGGTKYSALAMHADAKGCTSHAAMGFHDGWGKALDQLVELAHSLSG